MKKLLALLLSCTLLLTGCAWQGKNTDAPTPTERVEPDPDIQADDARNEETPAPAQETEELAELPEFTGMSDPTLLRYVQDNVYAELVDRFASEDYYIENISAIYVSKEYLEELAYNSQANVFFGYTLEDLDAEFQGTR